jgi:hypothetical protein
MNQELLEKLVVARKIMEKQNSMQRGSTHNSGGSMVESFEPVNAKYNIPQELLGEAPQPKQVPNNLNTKDRILNSKLPEEIKRLMIEHPIEQPKAVGSETILSDEIVEAASRLMKTDASGKVVGQSPKKQVITESIPNTSDLRSMLKEVVKEVLSEQGVITESTQKTKEHVSFRVGQHIFEGVITKIKKVK